MNKFRRSLLSVYAANKPQPYRKLVTCIVSNNRTPIDTMIKPTENTTVEVDMLVPGRPYYTPIFGVIDTNRFYVWHSNADYTYYYNGTDKQAYAGLGNTYNNRSIWKINNKGLYINEMLRIDLEGNISGNYAIYAFGVNDHGMVFTADNTVEGIKIYKMTITDNNETVSELLPCVSNDGRAAFYDTVRKEIFYPVNGNWTYEE